MTLEFFLGSVITVYIVGFTGGYIHGFFIKVITRASQ
jgi:hypothetical protein